MRRTFGLLLLAILISSPVYALTITPAYSYVDFKPNKTIEGNCEDIQNPGCICIKGDGMSDIQFSAQGDLKEIILFHENRTLLKTLNNWECRTYDIVFPAYSYEAGENLVKVIITAYSEEKPSYLSIGTDQKLYIEVDEKYTKDYVPQPLTPAQIFLVSSPFVLLVALIIFVRKRREKR